MCLNLVQSTAASYFLRTVALGCELYLDLASMPISVPDSDRCNHDSSQVALREVLYFSGLAGLRPSSIVLYSTSHLKPHRRDILSLGSCAFRRMKTAALKNIYGFESSAIGIANGHMYSRVGLFGG